MICAEETRHKVKASGTSLRTRLSVSAALLSLLMVAQCIEPYTLEGVSSDPDFLVVDGFVNASSGSATVRLSRAVGLNSEEEYPAVTDAIVSIESEDGDVYYLNLVDPNTTPGYGPGTYLAEGLTIDPGQRYRLLVTTGPGISRQYQSEFVTIQKSAPIESIEYRADEEDVKILVNTAEGEGTSTYYRWKYQEAFEYNAPWFSSWYMNEAREMVYRSPSEQVYICYREDPSYEILIGSSQDLTSNVIRNYKVRSIPRTSVKLSRTYSINVQQLGLTEDAYTYWLNLYKTTESTGGLFDPLPGQVFGNIHSLTDPDEFVIGFFSGSTVEEKRIFINRLDLPELYVDYRAPFCDFDTVLVEDLEFVSPASTFGTGIYDQTGLTIIGYTLSSPSCLNCIFYQGGTTTKPDYWP